MSIQPERSAKLNKSFVRGLEAEEKRYRVFDTDLKGFFVQVDVTGSKVYRIRKAFRGERFQLRVGDAKIMTVEEARARAREMLRDIDQGIKPDRNDRTSFSEVAALTRAGASYGQLSVKSRSYYDGYLERLVLPAVGGLPIAEVGRPELKQLFERVFQESGACAVHGARSAAGKVFEYAVDAGMIPENPAKGMKRLSKPVVRTRFLQPQELKAFWEATARPRVSGDIRDALRICVLTVLRRSEVAEATWSEIDFSKKLWTVPTERTKRKKAPYLVPLSPAAEEILRGRVSALETPPAPSDRIFKVRPDSLTQSMTKLTSKKPFEAPFSPHDLRRTLSTIMAGEEVREELLERVLNHAPSNRGAIRSYNHHDYLRQKRGILSRWAEFVEGCVNGTITCLPGDFSH